MFSRFTVIFAVFLAAASVSLASLVNILPNIAGSAALFGLEVTAFAISSLCMCLMLRSYVLAYENAEARQ